MKKYIFTLSMFLSAAMMLWAEKTVQVGTTAELNVALSSADVTLIQLTADLPSDKAIGQYCYDAESRPLKGKKTLDLQGHQLHAHAYLMSYTTADDSLAITGNGKWFCDDPYAFYLGGSAYDAPVKGKLAIENGTFSYTDSYAFFWCGNKTLQPFEIVINGGNFNLASGRFIYLCGDKDGDKGPSITINDAAVVDASTLTALWRGATDATITVNGGSFYMPNYTSSGALNSDKVNIGTGKKAYLGGKEWTGSNLDIDSATPFIYQNLLQVGDASDFVNLTLSQTSDGSAVLRAAAWDSYCYSTDLKLKKNTPFNLTVKALPNNNITFNGWALVKGTELSDKTAATATFAVGSQNISMKAYFGSNALPKEATNKKVLANSYYNSLLGANSGDLMSYLCTLTKGKYDGVIYGSGNCEDCVWGAFATTDVYPDDYDDASLQGKMWDMYGTCGYDLTDHGSSAAKECAGGYNREHSLPKSWFGISGSDLDGTYTGAGTDLFHIYPTDVKVNSDRGNLPFGVVSNASNTYINGSKIGPCSWPTSYTSNVFEPADEYKGDFARSYMYMVVCWGKGGLSFTQKTQGAVMFNDTYTAAGHYGLTDYGVALLMKWHHDDPVSQKEIDRNNAVEAVQGNRNPFIDLPELADYIWGDNSGSTFPSAISSTVATFDDNYDVESGEMSGTVSIKVNTSLAFEDTPNGSTSVKTLTMKGKNLENAISLTLSGTDADRFSLDKTAIAAASANETNTVAVTFSPTGAERNNEATLTITCGNITKTVSLSGINRESQLITWLVNSEVYKTEFVTKGDVVTAPDDPEEEYLSCYSWKQFAGWTENEDPITTEDNTILTFDKNTSISSLPLATSDLTFRAVYGDKETTDNRLYVTFSGDDFSGEALNTCGNSSQTITASKSNITITYSKGCVDSYNQIRAYSGETVTFSTTDSRPITSIEVTAYSNNTYQYGALTSSITTNTGSYEGATDGKTGTWTGSASSVTWTAKAQIRFLTFKVTIGQRTEWYEDFITDCETYAVPFLGRNLGYDDVNDTYIFDTLGIEYVKHGARAEYLDIYVPDSVDEYNSHHTFTFAGWLYSTDTLTAEDIFPVVESKYVEFNIAWKESWTDYRVDFEGYPDETQYFTPDGGGLCPECKVAKPSVTPTRNGYEFAGWTTNVDETILYCFGDWCNESGLYDFEHTPVNGDLILYQAWKPSNVDFIVQLYGQALSDVNDGGTIGTGYPELLNSQTVTGKTGQTISEAMANASYSIPIINGFVAYDEDDLSQELNADGTTIHKVYCNRSQYKMAWDLDGGTETDYSQKTTGNVYFGAHFYRPMVEKQGYRLSKWVPDAKSAAAGLEEIVIDASGEVTSGNGQTIPAISYENQEEMDNHYITFTAVWTPRTDMQYEVRHFRQGLDGLYNDYPDSEEIYYDGETEKYMYLADLTLMSCADNTEWCGFTAEYVEFQIQPDEEDNVIDVHYARNKHNVAWDANGGSGLDGITDPYTKGSTMYGAEIVYPDGTLLTAPKGKVFYDWQSDCADFVGTMPDQDITFKAVWGNEKKQVSIVVVSSDPNETKTADELLEEIQVEFVNTTTGVYSWVDSEKKGDFEVGGYFELSITAVGNYEITNIDKPLSFTMGNQALVITVTISPKLLTVAVSASKDSNGLMGTASASGSTQFRYNSDDEPVAGSGTFSLTLTATANNGYKFIGWVNSKLMEEEDWSAQDVISHYNTVKEYIAEDEELDEDAKAVILAVINKLFSANATFSAEDVYICNSVSGLFNYDDNGILPIVAAFEKKDTATDIDATEVEASRLQAVKVIVDGKLFIILPDGSRFDAQGKAVKLVR